MLCPANMLGYLYAIRLAQTGARRCRHAVIPSGVARFCCSRAFGGRATQTRDLSWIENIAVAPIEERFFDESLRLD
jgi:hypothetical protein